jgi:beta-galactosidase
MRKRILFNDDWLFAPERLPLDAPDDLFEAVTLPHTNKVFPHHNFDNRDYQFISTYRRRFDVSPDHKEQHVFLEFDGVMLACTVYLNGQRVGEHLGGYISFSVDITDEVREGENTLTVYVDSREREDIPPYGHLVDYLTFGGIYRDVHLKIVNSIHIENIFVQTSDVLNDPRLACDVRLSQVAAGLALKATLVDQQGDALAVTHCPLDAMTTRLSFDSLPDVGLWSLDSPTLYSVHVALTLKGELLDATSSRFGFREAEFRPDGGFYLNGERVRLLGLNRHQIYPYIGAAAPARLQRQDADILKYELACNVVRTSHYPQSPHFLDRCDEVGLLVFEEITGWQHIGDQKWRDIALSELAAMIERDRNHPAIILWGVRINESQDNDAFYTRTNTLAHKLDPTRQTGGVRCFLGSSFLEDVYTYNDFSNTVLEPTEQPYLITEFAGHMFPTKIWDHEQRLIDHALLHAKIHNLQLGDDRIAGAIGWCAFDYATHKEFGSGDRICYHGVMDMFRLPKWAAYLYQSQQSPSKRVVLRAATHWTMGDRAEGGVNPLTVFSNCDEVEIIVGETSVGRFQPDDETYPHLPHPPFTIRGLDEYSAWGQAEFYDLQLVGYLDGERVAEQWIASSRLPHTLALATDTDQLYADGADMTRLIFRITDEFGNPLSYATKVVTFEIEGEADLIGENPFPLIGGQAALYVKARHQPGAVVIRAQASGLPEASVTLDIVPVPEDH